MMKNLINMCVLISSINLLVGCSGKEKEEKYSEITIGTHLVKIRPYSDSVSTSSHEEDGKMVHQVICGAVTVVIKDKKVIFNGKRYGMCFPGDTVVIDNGTVKVNDSRHFEDFFY